MHRIFLSLLSVGVLLVSCGPTPPKPNPDPCQKANAGPDKVIKLGETTELGANDFVTGVSYNWFPKAYVMSPNTHKTLVQPTMTTVYLLKVVNQCGISSDSVKVTVVK